MKIENTNGNIEITIGTTDEEIILLKYLLLKEFGGKLNYDVRKKLYDPIKRDVAMLLLHIEYNLVKQGLIGDYL